MGYFNDVEKYFIYADRNKVSSESMQQFLVRTTFKLVEYSHRRFFWWKAGWMMDRFRYFESHLFLLDVSCHVKYVTSIDQSLEFFHRTTYNWMHIEWSIEYRSYIQTRFQVISHDTSKENASWYTEPMLHWSGFKPKFVWRTK